MFSSAARFFLLSVFLILPFSDSRTVVFGVPVYVQEWIVLVATAFFSTAIIRGEVFLKKVPTLILAGSVLMLFGLMASLYGAGFSAHGLGALKSWFVFPMIFSFLLFQLFDEKNSKEILFFWFLSAIGVASASLFPGSWHETYDERIRLHYPSPNHLAFVLEYGLVIGVWFLWRSWKKKEAFLVVASNMLLVWALVATRSSGALFAVSAGIVSLLLLKELPKKKALTVLFAVFVSGVILLGSFLAPIDWETLLSGEERSSLASRAMIWSSAWHLIAENPFLGIGPRNFQEAYLSLQPMFPPYLEWAVPHPHNVILSFWLSSGIFGLIGFLVLLTAVFSALRAADRKASISVAAISVFVVFLVHGLVDTPYFRNDLSFFFWGMIALASISLRGDFKEKKKGVDSPSFGFWLSR